jgi:alpha-L-fucosidase
MGINRRDAIKLLAGAAAALKAGRVLGSSQAAPPIQSGPFEATRESLKAYRIPDWYRDAKFGIWNHWGPQSAAEYGDWYARGMYLEGEWQYKHHVQTYGHPSKFGFKDVIET